MTEVPEHLLRRSKERRAALGLDGGGGDGGDATPPAPPAAAGEPAEPAGDVPAVAAATTTPAPPPVPVEAPPPPVPPYVVAAVTRPKVPRWAVPVLAVLPIWALIYAGTMTAGEAGITDPVLAEGEELYSANCAACHGANGEGGTGRPLHDGDVLLTFPDPAEHIAWVVNGSPASGTPYGDPNRPGGQHVSQSDGFGAMPAFGSTLTEEQIVAVVRYEREIIGGETESALAAGGEAGADTTTVGEGASPSTPVGEDASSSTTVAGQEGTTPSTTPGATGGNVGGSGGSGTPDTTTPEAATPGSTVPGGPATTVPGTAGNDLPDSSTPAPPSTTVAGSG